MADIEASAWIIGRHEHEPPVHQRCAMLAQHSSLLQTIPQYPDDLTSGFRSSPHRSLIDSLGTSRHHRIMRPCGHRSYCLGITDQIIIDMARAYDG
ncbi:hypothetical protein ASE59_11180 [Sphingomonas sp. Leaf10]|nr:hypothetical protein ASE59_11180 [Sphingomonas sp. Leaf10]